MLPLLLPLLILVLLPRIQAWVEQLMEELLEEGVAVSAGASPPRRTILGCGHVRAGDRAVVGEVDVRATASDTAPPHQQKICVRSPARLGAAALPAGSIRPAQPKRKWLAVGMVVGVDADEMDDLQYRQFQQRDGDQQRREFQRDLGDVDIRRRLSDGGRGAVVSTRVGRAWGARFACCP